MRRETGELDENFPDVGRYIFTAGEYLFALNAAIPRGYALACQIIYKISAAQLTFARIFLGSTIKSWIYARKPLGIIVPGLAAIAGDAVLAAGSRCRIVPDSMGISRLDGVVLAKNYVTPQLGIENFIYNLAADTPNQICAINTAAGGWIEIKLNNQLTAAEAVRALISTEAGETNPSSWSNSISLKSNQMLQIHLSHPCDSNGYGTIRDDYPALAIAGNKQGKFNQPKIRIYLKIEGKIYRLPQEPIAIAATQTLTILTFSGAELLQQLPSQSDYWFNLWKVATPKIEAANGMANIPTNKLIQIAITYYYSSPNIKVTKIDHRENLERGGGLYCLPEIDLTLAQMAQKIKAGGSGSFKLANQSQNFPAQPLLFLSEEFLIFNNSSRSRLEMSLNLDLLKEELESMRKLLKSNQHFWVLNSGDDLDNASQETPFKTLQKAADIAALLDLGLCDCYIHFSGTLDLKYPLIIRPPLSSGGKLIFKGSGIDTSYITSSQTLSLIKQEGEVSICLLEDFTLSSSSSATTKGALITCSKGELQFQNLKFAGGANSNTGQYQIFAEGGIIKPIGNYQITGDGFYAPL
ncbi:hypothetical protein [Gloeothece verrucosa]|uniref:Uncharacterized protein n=1 Tax=Gloeothece verrucosa (strain PCC 7822) TaxID=497965 RepID=E0UFV8_GLOV7|nr:hypothetical protein [Gloeothece verrucosa]ADN14341.1 hypothetical protein Cyan7822_2363 [Gloeothece verrucosa PCC 7822]